MNNINKMFDNLGLAGSMPGVGGALGAGAVNPLVGSLGLGALNPLGAALGLGATDPAAAGGGAGVAAGDSLTSGFGSIDPVDAGMMPMGQATGEFTGLSPSNASASPLSGFGDEFSGDVIMNLPGSDGPAQVEEEFNYSKMLESISKGTEKLASAEDSPDFAPAMGTNRGALPGGSVPMMYGNLTEASPGMNAIQSNRPMMGGPQNIQQVLQALSGR